ncbi:MAG TPA: carbon-nitrogen hydrolase family protein [Marmoricola sp.]|nr:carbon-nitrogen hydrolase family protein [Marmoricola sp.]
MSDAVSGAVSGAGQSLRVALVQWAASLDPLDNRAALDDLAAVAEDADLVVLPEAFARDFGEPTEDLAPYAETLDGPFVRRLRELAEASGTPLLAGMFERDAGADDRPFNTLVLAGPDSLTSYRKIHLYDSFGYRESDRLRAGGTSPVTVDVDGLRLGLLTCYDLRFPEMARHLVDAGAEVLVVPAAWVAGEGKVHHWRTLATARAIENTCYVVAVGQPGPRYTGHSLVVAPDGQVLVEGGDGPEVLTATLERDVLAAVRHRNPSLANRRL